MSIEKPEFVTYDHLDYLNQLRASGDTNMLGAIPYILSEFPELTKAQARSILTYWMDSFGERETE